MARTLVTVEVTGLVELVRQMKGPAFRDVNQALRPMARGIADELRPHVQLLVGMSAAPQAAAMAKTVRTKPDRVPVIVIGKVNPRFRSGFSRRGQDSKLRRGSIAHGVIYGPKGGHRSTAAHENYYRIPRDDSGGAFGRSVKTGRVFDQACEAYLKGWLAIMKHHGFATEGPHAVTWKG